MADIDHFKQVNDTFGHFCGDYVLKEVVKYLDNNLRQSDFIARWGGEEFLMVFPETDLEQVQIILKRIQNYFRAHPIHWEDKNLNITLTFGVQQHQNNINLQQTLELVDMALYQGKLSGRNCIIISQ